MSANKWPLITPSILKFNHPLLCEKKHKENITKGEIVSEWIAFSHSRSPLASTLHQSMTLIYGNYVRFILYMCQIHPNGKITYENSFKIKKLRMVHCMCMVVFCTILLSTICKECHYQGILNLLYIYIYSEIFSSHLLYENFLWGPNVGPIWGWDEGGWKDLCETTPNIKFDLKPMPLTPSSVAHKFNGSYSKKDSTIDPMVQSIWMCANPWNK